jgi:sucrose-phosphate synthase
VWERHINYQWNPQAIRDILAEMPGLKIQPKINQGTFKISYYVDHALINAKEIRQTLLRNEQAVNTVFSFGQFLDVVPVRASKGLALRWCAEQLGFPLENTLVTGVTGADADMLLGNTLGAVVDDRHLDELSGLSNIENIYFSEKHHAAGILESIEHYNFFAAAQEGTVA